MFKTINIALFFIFFNCIFLLSFIANSYRFPYKSC